MLGMFLDKILSVYPDTGFFSTSHCAMVSTLSASVSSLSHVIHMEIPSRQVNNPLCVSGFLFLKLISIVENIETNHLDSFVYAAR